ncbi:hypothetical protein V492_06772 [Pseudogymnoascus sp. VKM F-4246]|nr:hypothetical protein V492_06772 [Pseudogymnoascus sp. VKM F-4246]
MPSPPPTPSKSHREPGDGDSDSDPQPTPQDEIVIFATEALLDATIKRLADAKRYGVWESPKMDGTLLIDLDVQEAMPEFIPMSFYVDGNWLKDGEVVEPQSEPEGSIAVPATLLKFAKGIELIHHHMPGQELRNCIPKAVPKYAKRSISFTHFENKAKEHVAAVTRGTLDRGFHTSCAILEVALKSQQFIEALEDPLPMNRVAAINDFLRPEHIHWIYGDQFRAISFPFIFHDAIRPVASEEKLRQELRTFLRFTTCHMIYDYLRYVIRVEEGFKGMPLVANSIGKTQVRKNYLITPRLGPAAQIYKSLARLPASHDFDTHSKRMSLTGTSGIGDGWTDGQFK